MLTSDWWSRFAVGAALGLGVLLLGWLVHQNVRKRRQKRIRTLTVAELVHRIESEGLPTRPGWEERPTRVLPGVEQEP